MRVSKSKANKLVVNNQAVVANQLQEVTANVSAPRIRHEILEGRNYTVVPMVMITEGVHAGSNGPLYYPSTELAKTPAVWNHKPVVVYHPTQNGSAISACEPAVISRRKVGIILNTKYIPGGKGQPGKLKAEAWLQTDRLAEVDERVSDAVKTGTPMEVSTGLFTDNELKVGRFGTKNYDAIARNYRPDHLAILPDEKGACSLADGAGLLRNSNPERINEMLNNLGVALSDLTGASVEVTARKTEATAESDVAVNTGAPMTKSEIVNALIANEQSLFDADDRKFLMGVPDARLQKMATNAGIKHASSGCDTIDSSGDDGQLPDSENGVVAKKPTKRTVGSMNKFTEAPDDDEAEEPADDGDEDDMPPQFKKKGKAPTKNVAEPVSVEDYIANAPAGMRDVLESGLRAHNVAKGKLIATITANKANRFTREGLEEKPLEELQALAALAGSAPARRPVANNYIGLGEVAQPEMTENQGLDEEEALPIPVMNFAKVGA